MKCFSGVMLKVLRVSCGSAFLCAIVGCASFGHQSTANSTNGGSSPDGGFKYALAARSVVGVYCEETKSGGGGVVLSKTTIISMLHVVDTCREVKLRFFDGTIVGGRVLSVDETRDLVRIVPDRVPEFVEAATLEIAMPELGDVVYLVAHPNGLMWSYSRGYVGFPKERDVPIGDTTVSVLQVNIDVFAGSSGGGLFNDAGHVVGFAEGYLEGTSIAFFIPSEAACKKLIKCKEKSEAPSSATDSEGPPKEDSP